MAWVEKKKLKEKKKLVKLRKIELLVISHIYQKNYSLTQREKEKLTRYRIIKKRHKLIKIE